MSIIMMPIPYQMDCVPARCRVAKTIFAKENLPFEIEDYKGDLVKDVLTIDKLTRTCGNDFMLKDTFSVDANTDETYKNFNERDLFTYTIYREKSGINMNITNANIHEMTEIINDAYRSSYSVAALKQYFGFKCESSDDITPLEELDIKKINSDTKEFAVKETSEKLKSFRAYENHLLRETELPQFTLSYFSTHKKYELKIHQENPGLSYSNPTFQFTVKAEDLDVLLELYKQLSGDNHGSSILFDEKIRIHVDFEKLGFLRNQDYLYEKIIKLLDVKDLVSTNDITVPLAIVITEHKEALMIAQAEPSLDSVIRLIDCTIKFKDTLNEIRQYDNKLHDNDIKIAKILLSILSEDRLMKNATIKTIDQELNSRYTHNDNCILTEYKEPAPVLTHG